MTTNERIVTTKERIMPTLGKNSASGLASLVDAVDLKKIINDKEALAAYNYLQALCEAVNSDAYKERQSKKSEWVKKARQDGRYNFKGKI